MNAFTTPVTLRGRHVQLEPLSLDHVDALAAAVCDGELWNLWYTSVPRPEGVADYVRKAQAMHAAGEGLPFAVRDLASDQVVGCTRYYEIDPGNRRVAIGYTWYAARVQRTAVNTESKRLLLGHAFDDLGCIAVTFHTHWHNQRSRAAIARLGARQEGVLRNHRILDDGSYRDTVLFSILESEWPGVRRDLDMRLARGAAA